MTTGVSFVVPVLNGRRHLRRVLGAIMREAQGHRYEIVLVDDGSTDGSQAIVESIRSRTGAPIDIVKGPAQGAAAAVNAGIRQARYSLIAQIDQDVVPQRGWLSVLLNRLEADDAVVAAQGRYIVPPAAGFWARMSGRDLDLRYADLRRKHVDHVCTGNTVYRAADLHLIGLFDERLGYGYDNDVSYRLITAGGTLAFCPDATAEHYWREGLSGYVRQQFGVGYGRLDLLRSHPGRWTGDAVSGAVMMAHGPLALAAVLLAGLSPIWPWAAACAAGIVAALACERSVAAFRAWRLTGDRATLLFPAAHLARDAAWAAAIVTWTARRLSGGSRPGHSMPRRTRPATAGASGGRVLVLIPAYNEAANLPLVVEDVRAQLPEADVLVINDASTDETRTVVRTLGVKWLTLTQRIGVGGALRAGVRYARRHEYGLVGRIDGDGQHRASDLRRLIRAVQDGHADVAAGSRYLGRRGARRAAWQRMLAAALTFAARERVTDPTSGIWAFGAQVLPVLDEHHPGGYPEPELRLLLAKHRMHVAELPVPVKHRRSGRTSLTPGRSAIAFARTALALALAAVGGSVTSRE